jgi:DNA polymerase-4
MDVNGIASRRGVAAKMPLAQAKTILREDGVYRNLLAEDCREAQEEWLELASQFTGVIEPEDRNSAYLDLSSHPKPVDIARRFLERLARLTGCEPILGAGASKWLALLSADTYGEHLLPLEERGLSPISTLSLSPISIEQRERLRFLGYHTIGQVADLPMSTLRGQFGDDALRILLAARGSWKDPVEALYPPNTLSERFIFDGAIASSLLLDEALVSLGHRIGVRLEAAEQHSCKNVVNP